MNQLPKRKLKQMRKADDVVLRAHWMRERHADELSMLNYVLWRIDVLKTRIVGKPNGPRTTMEQNIELSTLLALVQNSEWRQR